MRTKSLMTAGALAMFMAACSNEELVTSNEQLSMERPLAGEVVVTPIFGSDADSRALWQGNGWDFEAGDKFAAYLMDTWNEVGTEFTDYTLTDYIHTNYPFMAEGTAPNLVWKSVAGAPLCEGNYFFAWPFNAEYANRGQIGFSVNDVQYAVQMADGEDEERFFILGGTKENQKYLGYSFVEAANGDVNNVDISFLPVFATPKFKIKNSTNGAIKVDKMLIRAHEGGDRNTYQTLPTTVMLNPASGKFDGMDFMNATTTAGKIAALQKALVVKNNPADCVYEYVIDCGNEQIEKDAYLKIAAVIPGGEYGRLDIFLFVEDQDGEKEKSIVRLSDTEKPEWCDKDQGASMHTNMVVGEQQVYTATIYDQSLGNIGVEGFTVVNSADLEYVLKFKAIYGGKEKLKITTWGDNVVMTEEIYKLLAVEDRKNLELYINGKITIPAGVPADAIDQLANDDFFGHITTVINQGNQELAKGTYHFDIVNYGTITEPENKPATIEGDVIVEEGSVSVSTINGDVTVKEGAELVAGTVTGDVVNNGTADIETVNGDVENNNELTINNVTGKLTNNNNVVAEGGKLTEVDNYGTFKVTGATTAGESTEKKFINFFGANLNVEAELGGRIYNHGTVNNLDSIVAGYMYNYSDGIINNGAEGEEGAPSIKTVKNDGIVNAYAASVIKSILNNEKKGELHVWSADVDITHAASSKGTTIFEGVDAQHVGYFVNGIDQCPDELRVYRAYSDKTTSELEATGKITKFEEVWTSYNIHFNTKGSACKSYFNKIKVESNEVSFTVGDEAKEDTGYIIYANTTFEVAENALMNLENNSMIGVKAVDGGGEIHVATGSSLWVGVINFKNYNGATEYKGHQIIKL